MSPLTSLSEALRAESEQTHAETLTVALADDSAAFRAAFRALIALAPGVTLVGEAENGVEALRLVEEKRPLLLVLDIQMPEMDGWDVMSALHRAGSPVLVLAISSYMDPQMRRLAIQRGASAALLKDDLAQIIDVMERLARSR